MQHINKYSYYDIKVESYIINRLKYFSKLIAINNTGWKWRMFGTINTVDDWNMRIQSKWYKE